MAAGKNITGCTIKPSITFGIAAESWNIRKIASPIFSSE